MKINILYIILFLSIINTNVKATCQELTGVITNNDFNCVGDGWATGWSVSGGVNPSSHFNAHGKYAFLWDGGTISQTISIEPNTNYQIKFLGAYSVKKDGTSDESNSTYQGQYVKFSYGSGSSKTQNVTHWVFDDDSLDLYTVNLGNSGSSDSLKITGYAGKGNSFIKLDYFKLYKCSSGGGSNPPPTPTPPEKVKITKKIKLTIYNDDVKFIAKQGKSEDIQTKIVNKSFLLNIYSVDENKNIKKNKVASNVKVRLIPFSSSCGYLGSNAITSWSDINIENKESVIKSFISSTANKNVKVQIKWKVNNKEKVSCCSLDNFAIRPDKFLLNLPSGIIKAGNDFVFNIKALDNTNKPTYGYNKEKGKSFEMTYKDKKSPTCSTGNISFSKTVKFSNGNFKDNHAKYNNVGVVDIKIAEIKGKEFAKVDAKDTPDKQRLIEENSTTVTFVPSKFKIKATLSDVVSGMTFYANSSDVSTMGSLLDINVTATSASGVAVSNYTNGCYSKDTNLTILYTNSNTKDTQTIVSNKSILSQNSSQFVLGIDKSKYINATAKNSIKLNLDRDNKTVKNPSLFTITKVIANDSSISTNIFLSSLNKAHFYYGRAHAPSPQTSTTKSFDAKVYYEVYCKGCNKTIFTKAKGQASIDEVFWYILSPSTVSSFGSVCDYQNTRSLNLSATSKKDIYDINITAPALPHRDKIFYTPTEAYLRYHKFGTALPEHFFDVKFTSENKKWAGEGDRGKTVDTNISQINNQSIDW